MSCLWFLNQVTHIFNFKFSSFSVFVFPAISSEVPDTEVNIFRRARGYSQISHGWGNRFVKCNEERTYPQCRLSWLWPGVGLFHLTCLAGQWTEVSGAHELPSSPFSSISSKHYKYWHETALNLAVYRDIGGNLSLSVFLVEIHTNMAWPMLSPPYLWVNLACLEREICHNSTCQRNKPLIKPWTSLEKPAGWITRAALETLEE